MIVHAIGMLVAPANTADETHRREQRHRRAERVQDRGTERRTDHEQRRDFSALKPEPSVIDVNSNFSANAAATTPAPPASDLVISGIDTPRLSRVPTAHVSPTMIRPTDEGRRGVHRTPTRNAA